MQRCPVSDGYVEKPMFGLNRNLITTPYINATADQLYADMIPNNPDGDCKALVSLPAGQRLPFFNITLGSATV